jgi:hypothetical protein
MTEYCFCQLALYNPVKNKADGIIISSKFIFSCHDVARLALTITHSLINYQRGRVGTLVTGSILPHCCDCLKPGPGLPTTCHSNVCVQLFEVRTDISGIIDHHCYSFHFAVANIFKGRWEITNFIYILQSNSNSEKKINVLFLNCLQNNIRTV